MEVLPWVWACSPSQTKDIDWSEVKVLWYMSADEPKFVLPQGIKKVRIADHHRSKDWIGPAREHFQRCEGQVIYWSNSHSHDKMRVFLLKWIKKDLKGDLDEETIMEFLKIFV